MSNTLRSRMRAIAGLWSPGNPALPNACFSVLGQISSSPASIRQPAPDLVFGSSDYRADPVASPGPPSRPSSLAAFVADLRIDNHDDLARELGLPPTASDDEVFA